LTFKEKNNKLGIGISNLIFKTIKTKGGKNVLSGKDARDTSKYKRGGDV